MTRLKLLTRLPDNHVSLKRQLTLNALQFWSLDGDEALLCLETLWRNGRWQHLFHHAKSSVELN